MPDITDSRIFAVTLDKAIVYAADRLRERRKGLRGEGTLPQLQGILMQLVDIRKTVQSGFLPPKAVRQSESLLWIFVDSWDPRDPGAEVMIDVMHFYLRNLHISPEGIASSVSPELRRAFDLAEEVRRLEAAESEQRQSRPPATHPDVLTMPHDPDKRSVDIAREAALAFVDAEGGRADAARAARDHRFLWDLSQQWLIVGLTDYWYRRPLSAVAFALRRGLGLAGEAIAAGYPAHAWDVSHRFLEAVALRVDGVAQQLIELHPEAWDHAGIKPVHWLVLRIHCCFALHRDRDQDLDRLLDDLQVAVFVDRLPAELADDLPELRNAYWLLKGLRMRDAAAFDRHLGERMAIRAASFRRGGAVAPMALCDLHALGLCRFARQRGMAVGVEHVYLPLGLLDEP